jgi:hypothetical protein
MKTGEDRSKLLIRQGKQIVPAGYRKTLRWLEETDVMFKCGRAGGSGSLDFPLRSSFSGVCVGFFLVRLLSLDDLISKTARCSSPGPVASRLLGQIFNLGVEAHDDLCDALVWLLQGLSARDWSCRRSSGSRRESQVLINLQLRPHGKVNVFKSIMDRIERFARQSVPIARCLRKQLFRTI